MPNTFELIASSTVGAGGASYVEFTSIPATFTDLQLFVSSRNANSSGGALQLTLNGVGASIRRLYGNGNGTVGSDTYAPDGSGMTNTSSFTANSFSSNTYYITNYTSSNQKSVSIDGVQESNQVDTYLMLFANLINTTSAVTTLRVTPSGSSFGQYTTADLYGVKNA